MGKYSWRPNKKKLFQQVQLLSSQFPQMCSCWTQISSSFVLSKLDTPCKEEPLTAFCAAWTTHPHRSSPCLQHRSAEDMQRKLAAGFMLLTLNSSHTLNVTVSGINTACASYYFTVLQTLAKLWEHDFPKKTEQIELLQYHLELHLIRSSEKSKSSPVICQPSKYMQDCFWNIEYILLLKTINTNAISFLKGKGSQILSFLTDVNFFFSNSIGLDSLITLNFSWETLPVYQNQSNKWGRLIFTHTTQWQDFRNNNKLTVKTHVSHFPKIN